MCLALEVQIIHTARSLRQRPRTVLSLTRAEHGEQRLQAEDCGTASSYFPPSLLTSTFPFKNAPSSIAILWVAMSPVTTADFLSSTRSEACRLPSSLPCTMTPLASTLAFTCPLGPTVRLFPFSRMLPSTWPSR